MLTSWASFEGRFDQMGLGVPLTEFSARRALNIMQVMALENCADAEERATLEYELWLDPETHLQRAEDRKKSNRALLADLGDIV